MSLEGIRKKNIKESIVAVGLGDKKGSNPNVIVGSGFIVNREGFVITAKHVLQSCLNLLRTPKYKGSSLCSFNVIVSGNTIRIDKLESNSYSSPVPDKDSEFYIDEDVDVALLVPTIFQNKNYLEIKNDPLELYSEVCICGYPGGNQSLAISDTSLQFDYRFSPMTEFGRISSLIPFDTKAPVKAIQTDIVTTGGSSGSPIVDPSDAKVIGIVTSIIDSTVEAVFIQNSKYVKVLGKAKIGPAFGPASGYFFDMVRKSLEIAAGKDVRGKSPLTRMGKLYTNPLRGKFIPESK